MRNRIGAAFCYSLISIVRFPFEIANIKHIRTLTLEGGMGLRP